MDFKSKAILSKS